MIYFKNKRQYRQAFDAGNDAEQRIHVDLRQILEVDCGKMLMPNFLSGGNMEEAKKLTIETICQRYNLPANRRYKEPDCLKSWILETAVQLCDRLPKQWRQAVAQLGGEEDFTAEGIRSILGALPDRQQGFAWLYIFEAVSLEATSQVFRMSEDLSQKVLAEVKRFLRCFFSRLVDTANPKDPDEAIRLSLRRILNEAIETDVRFRIESRKMLKGIFAWVASDTRPGC